MKPDPHILLLAGSFEARQLADALTVQGCSYEAWLAEAPRGAALMAQVPLLRRFDDTCAMQSAVAQGGFTAVIDAAHVFDDGTSDQARCAAEALGLPYIRLLRRPWQVHGQPNIRVVPDVASANAMIRRGARVFCATGWDSLPDYELFCGEVLLLRQTRRHQRPAPYPFVEMVFGDPPFSALQEQELFTRLQVDVLVCRNLGGDASRSKLDAANALGLEVILIDRPCPPQGVLTVNTPDAVLSWLDAL